MRGTGCRVRAGGGLVLMAAGEGGYWLAAVAEGVRRRESLLLLVVVTRRALPAVAGCWPSLTGDGCCDSLSAPGGR